MVDLIQSISIIVLAVGVVMLNRSVGSVLKITSIQQRLINSLTDMFRDFVRNGR